MTNLKQEVRYNNGKPRLSLILEAPNALAGAARVMQSVIDLGKYGRSSWKNGYPITEIIDSMLRHQTAYMNGEDIDPETGERHVDCITCNALFLGELTHIRPDLDERTATATGSIAGTVKEDAHPLEQVVTAIFGDDWDISSLTLAAERMRKAKTASIKVPASKKATKR